MIDLGFSSCLADSDFWICEAMKPYGYKYWEYILVHYDDLLVISQCANLVMKGFDILYTLKPDADGKNGPSQQRILELILQSFKSQIQGRRVGVCLNILTSKMQSRN